jgi:hypothetical protein
MRCPFCFGDHTIDQCLNIDPEQYAEVVRRRRPHGLYGIFWQTDRPMWTMERSKTRALRYGKQVHGYVTRMPLPTSTAWDAPTFKVCSDLIADYRTGDL